MKTNTNFSGTGMLKTEFYQSWANYYLRLIRNLHFAIGVCHCKKTWFCQVLRCLFWKGHPFLGPNSSKWANQWLSWFTLYLELHGLECNWSSHLDCRKPRTYSHGKLNKTPKNQLSLSKFCSHVSSMPMRILDWFQNSIHSDIELMVLDDQRPYAADWSR